MSTDFFMRSLCSRNTAQQIAIIHNGFFFVLNLSVTVRVIPLYALYDGSLAFAVEGGWVIYVCFWPGTQPLAHHVVTTPSKLSSAAAKRR